jgi:putative transposase
VEIHASYAARRGRYGWATRLTELDEAGERASEKRAGRLMREDGLQARARQRFRLTTMSEHDESLAANVLGRQFAADRPNQRWWATRRSS